MRRQVVKAMQTQYDSKGFNTGLQVAEIFADYETRLIANRRKLFKNAIISDNFKLSVFNQHRAYNEANAAEKKSAVNDVTRLVVRELNTSYSVGVNSVDKDMTGFIKQGYEPKKQPDALSDLLIDKAKLILVVSAVRIFTEIAEYARRAANNQLMIITNQVNPQAENLNEEIDRVQAGFLISGVPGKQLIDGTEKQMTAESEFAMRDQSHLALQTAQGQRRQEYGIKLIQVSSHPSSCPLCTPWQGMILYDDRSGGTFDSRYETLSTALAAGLGHFNCRHAYLPYIEGYKNVNYEYDKASKEETAKRYAVEQQQRYNERNIREYKRVAVGSMSEQERIRAELKIEEWQARQRALRDIAERNKLPFYRQYSREQIGGKTYPNISRFLS